jgi:glycosyltransferase involved in cell wall biosynthesis
MVSPRQIDILISTYNGEKFLAEQLESIISQDINDWHILIRDDGSHDESVSITKHYAELYPDKITVIAEPAARLGVPGAYQCLLNNSRSQYVAFCDQDDVWLPSKLRILRERIELEENVSGRETPILVHSDLHVVDEDLVELSDSFWKYQKLNPSKMQSLQRLLIQNCVTGCAAIINRALVRCALPIPKDAIMHDWWFALIAAAQGKIIDISNKTVEYRQHESNDTGAKKWGLSYVINSLVYERSAIRQSLLDTRDQAIALYRSDKLDTDRLAVVSAYINMFDRGWLSKRVIILRTGFFMYGILRNLAVIILL